jgi:hypothetical protein
MEVKVTRVENASTELLSTLSHGWNMQVWKM